MSGFKDSVGKFAENSKSRVNQIKQGVCIKLFSAIIKDTPVLSGRLRGNWQFSKNAPIETTTTRTEDSHGSAVTNDAIQVILGTSRDDAVYMVNNLPYAHRIEYDGWSHDKAPTGMVRQNVARFNQLLAQQAAKSNPLT